MKITEKQIEDLIYQSPWLLDERFIIPNIQGSEGKLARQVNLGKGKSRFIDLLFKDTRDDRPVIVELKKGKLLRENIAQILEYRSLLNTVEENDKWQAEFGQNYYAPKLILIGSTADEEIILSANLAGIEIRTFDTEYSDKIGFQSFREIKAKLNAWNNFRDSGNRALEDRPEWIEEIIDKINEIIKDKKYKDVSTIKSVPKIGRNKTYNSNLEYPFIDIPIYYKGDEVIGIFEFYDRHQPFNDYHIYCEFGSLYSEDFDEDDIKQINKELNKIAKRKNLSLDIHPDLDSPTFLIPRNILENNSEFESLVRFLFDNVKRLHDKFINS